MRIPARLLPHSIKVRAYLGSGAYGERWGESAGMKRCLVEDKVQNVTDSAGQTVVSGTTVYMEPRDIPVGSLVTVWPGSDLEREAKVISIGRFDHPKGLSHQVVYLK